jgi:outer membrane protein OmpA-like peptidoglycan-associated protein
LDRGKIVRIALFIIALSMYMIGCARFVRQPEEYIYPPAPDAFAGIQADLNLIAQVEHLKSDELMLRFPGSVLFDFDEYSLRAGAESTLAAVAEILQKYPDFLVIVEGHTDSIGRESYNQWLSERRSRVVADVLVNKGLDPYRIQVVGYGELRPLASDDTPEGRQQNRRAEIHIKLVQQ